MTNWNWNYFNRFPASCWPIPPTVSIPDAATYLGVPAAAVGAMATDGRLSGVYSPDGTLSAINGASIQNALASATAQPPGTVPADIQSGVGPTG